MLIQLCIFLASCIYFQPFCDLVIVSPVRSMWEGTLHSADNISTLAPVMNYLRGLGLCFAVLTFDPPVACFLSYFCLLIFPLCQIRILLFFVFNSEAITCIPDLQCNNSINFTTYPALESVGTNSIYPSCALLQDAGFFF